MYTLSPAHQQLTEPCHRHLRSTATDPAPTDALNQTLGQTEALGHPSVGAREEKQRLLQRFRVGSLVLQGARTHVHPHFRWSPLIFSSKPLPKSKEGKSWLASPGAVEEAKLGRAWAPQKVLGSRTPLRA